jgi:hypothetical protein
MSHLEGFFVLFARVCDRLFHFSAALWYVPSKFGKEDDFIIKSMTTNL